MNEGRHLDALCQNQRTGGNLVPDLVVPPPGSKLLYYQDRQETLVTTCTWIYGVSSLKSEKPRSRPEERSHLVLQVVSQVHVLRGVWVVQQLSVTRIHQVDTELHNLLHRTLRDHVGKLRVLQDKTDSVSSALMIRRTS